MPTRTRRILSTSLASGGDYDDGLLQLMFDLRLSVFSFTPPLVSQASQLANIIGLVLNILAIPVDNDDDDGLPQLVSSPRLGVLPSPATTWSVYVETLMKMFLTMLMLTVGEML